MASRSTTLTVQVITDATKAAAGLQDTADRFESFSKKAAGAVAGFFVADKIAQGVKAVVSAASDMQQAMGGTDKIFGTSAQVVHAWAADTADDFRVPAVAAEKFATSLGNSLIQAGSTAAEAAVEIQDLGMVAADLAAAYGGNVVDALDAVNAAISKGEWERLESFGVTIKASDVSAEVERIAESFGGLTDASRPIIETQAKINLLMREAKPAAGAAAAEADTYAARMDSLKEKLGNAAAAIGGPVLDALGGLADGLAGATDSFTPAATAIAGFISNIAALPGPVLAAAAGLGGLLLLAPRFASFFSGIGTGMSGFMTQIRAMQTAAAAGGGSISTFAAGARVAGSSLLGALGGPWGIAFAAAAAAAAFGLIKWAEAAAETKRKADAANSAVAAFQSTLREGGNLKTTAFDQLAEGLKGLGSTITPSQLAKRFGMNQTDLVNALLGGDPQSVIDKMNSVIAPLIARRDQLMLDRSTISAAHAMDPDIEALENERDMIENLIPSLSRANQLESERKDLLSQGAYESRGAAEARWAEEAATTAVAEATDDLAEKLKEAQKYAASTSANTLLTRVADDAETAKRAVEILDAALDLLDGRGSDESALVNWSKSFQDALPVMQKWREEGELNLDALKRWDVIALQTGEGNQELYDTMSKQSDLYPELIGQVWAAAGGSENLAAATAAVQEHAHRAYGDFLQLATAAGLTDEEARQLAGTLGILDDTQISPKLFEVIAADEQARATVANIQAAQIGAKQFDITAGADQAFGTIDDVITYVDSTGALITVPVHADPVPAEGTVDAFTEADRQTNEVAILANSASARKAMEAFIGDYRNLTMTATLIGNTSPARGAMEAFRGDYGSFAITTTILGNSAPARNAISAVESGSYSATVKILADANPFWATFNALPGSKTVTMTTQQQTVVLPPVNGPVLFSAATAPSLARTAGAAPDARATASASQAGTNYTINIKGALWPDQAARAVEDVLRRRDRRRGSVNL